ncbi:hypothetical protein GEOBRER4_n3076 [Citrifermentans bremense]|uniref:NACHT domain-containing protein n=1 Tax=Citrifermentans bremense TaxID=60035 RepID=A0A6S6M1H5_9BACT|nr:NACHT domain-containing protein [Citrifermentans bremense]BCG48197.1 hypothetical protein GEOBRER4_n3076 [Citrifermentans bremense]
MIAETATALAKTALTQVVKDGFKSIISAGSKKYNQAKIEEISDNIYKNISEIKEVKTIWQTNKTVNITDFYCDQFIKHGTCRNIVRRISDLPSNRCILIEGIAGQGKSTLLKYLSVNEINKGRYIPIFIELKNIRENNNLLSVISSVTNALGIGKVDLDILSELCNNDRWYFVLDGFDEIAHDKKAGTILEIEEILRTIKTMKVVITSRPNSGLENSTLFEVIKLDQLINDEYKAYIMKLSDNTEMGTQLIDKIEAHKGEIKKLLCTPLLITLLVITYKSNSILPDNLSEFYESLFGTLLQRHDGVKPGVSRKKKCNINDFEIRQIFEALCFVSKAKDDVIFPYKDLYKWVTKASELQKVSINPECFIEDIVEITCLVLKEGDEYQFVHKSIREYFTAAFVQSNEEPFALKFYTNRLSSFHKWSQELRFLSEIDKYRYIKHFRIPQIENIFGSSFHDFESGLFTHEAVAVNILKSLGLLITSFRNSVSNGLGMDKNFSDCTIPNYNKHVASLFKLIRKFKVYHSRDNKFIIEYDDHTYEVENEHASGDKNNFYLHFDTLYANKVAKDQIYSVISDVISSLRSEMHAHIEYIKHESNKYEMLDEI